MTQQIFIPVRQYLEGLWPSSIVELPDVEAFEHIWMEPLNVQTDPDITVATALLFEASLELGIPGLDAVKLVIAPMGTATSFMLRFESAPVPSISLVSVPIALRLRSELLKPARQGAPDADGVRAWEVDPTREFVDIQIASVTLKFDFNGNIWLQAGASINLPPILIGDSGVAIEAQDIGLYFDTTAPPPGKPAGWKGVYIAHCVAHLPAGLSGSVGTLSIDDAYIGNGGFSGTAAVDFAPAISATLFGMTVSLEHVGLTFVQNALTGSEIRGTLTLPFFDSAIAISVAIGLEGSLSVAIGGGANGLVTLTKPGVLELSVDSLAFAIENGSYVVCLSGGLRPLLAGFDWPKVEIRELSIDSAGNVHVEGGWIDLRDGYRIGVAGFGLEVTRLGLGSTEDGGRWVGFNGALRLVDGMSAGASVDGLKLTWYDDGRPPGITLSGVGVEFEVPEVLRFKGAVSMRDLPEGVRRFDGAIKLELITLDMTIDGQLVVGTADGYSFFAIYLGAELPLGIPLWTTGLGLFGIAGLFALNMEPDKGAQEPWYGVGPGEGWYKRPQIGVTDLTKWRNEAGSLAVGAGITIGTVADNGFTFAGRMLLAIVFPGPIVLIEGKANLLKERSSLSDEPLFRSLAVIDGREGSFLVGLDVEYKFGPGGELIEIGGGAEAFFDFDEPHAWHLYLGQRNPRERRIRAEIFQLFEANAYFMLDAYSVATGAFIGYEGHWRFGPITASLEAWIEGNAALSSKPQHFHGDLWLHGRAEFRVFGFGFDIGADARVLAEVFEPYLIKIDVSAHLGLPWPLPDVDVHITLQWGPEPIKPPLPMPLKEIAIGHGKVVTTWPLPRTGASVLLAPNYDNDGFLGPPNRDPVVVANDPPPINAPVIPLDARPQISFGRNVHDDALVGVNPQPVFPVAQPEPGWEWIGDPSRNEGAVRIRTALKEVTLDRWQATAGTWVTIARKGPGPNPPGVQPLFGSWAPMPQLPGGAPGVPAPAAQTKLSLWSRSPFDYVRHTSRQWSEWWTSTMVNYPCVPIPDDEEVCCYFNDLAPGAEPKSPWMCPDHPEFALGWSQQNQPVGTGTSNSTMLCFSSEAEAELRLGVTVKRVRLFIHTGRTETARQCITFGDKPQRAAPNPYLADGFLLAVRGPFGTLSPATQLLQASSGRVGLDIDRGCTIRLPSPCRAVHLQLRVGAGLDAVATRSDGKVVDAKLQVAAGQQTLSLVGDHIERVTITAPANESVLYEVCVEKMGAGLEVIGIGRDGRQRPPVPLAGSTAEIGGSDLAAVRIRGGGQAFCISGFCVTIGLSSEERLRRERMNEHLLEETARWSSEGAVLQPHEQYRLRVVTTLETRGFAYDASFNKLREHTEFAYFRTSGPPGLVQLSAPIAAQTPSDASTALADLSPYVRQTTPPTVVPNGVKPRLPRPVFRAYDVSVDFNEDYVDLLYRMSGRDLGLYLFDNSNRPARDLQGRLLVAAPSWDAADQLKLTATDTAWVDLVNASTCASIDKNSITKTRTLQVDGQVLLPDTTYEARLTPLLLHETFAGMTIGQAAVGSGARLSSSNGAWVVVDAPAVRDGPSRWVIGIDGTPPMRYVEQQANAWAGPDVAGDPTNPGTILLRAPDPALPADHADQPANWADYRITAILRGVDNDAMGLAFRYRDAGNHLLFTMDHERSYRRLVRVQGGTYTTLASNTEPYPIDSDMTISVEAVGDRFWVYEDGRLLFDVVDSTHAAGGIGLYCWAMEGARFADIRVDDLRLAAPVVYRFSFTTSRFANFRHQMAGGSGWTWKAELPNADGLANGVAASQLPSALAAMSDAEWRALDILSGKIIGTASLQRPKASEWTAAIVGGGVAAVLVQAAEPIDWSRSALSIGYADYVGTAFAPTPDAIPATKEAHIIDWTSAPAGLPTPVAESVSLLLDEDLDPEGWRLEYRTFASPGAPDVPDRQSLLDDDFLGIGDSQEQLGSELFKPALNSLAGFSVIDPSPQSILQTSQWSAAAGTVKQGKLTGSPAGMGGAPYAMIGTQLVSDTRFEDVRITATVRSDGASGAFGLVFRHVNDQNYYRLSLSPTKGRRLIRRRGGLFASLWSDTGSVPVATDLALTIEAVGGAIRIWLDGKPLCALRDASISRGQVGFYTWRCKTASFRALQVNQLNQQLDEWRIGEFGALASAPTWQRGGAALKQIASIASSTSADATTQGSFALAGDDAWTDIRLRLRISAEPADGVGVALRWLGAGDHMLVMFDFKAGEASLVLRGGGSSTVLGKRAAALTPGNWYGVEIEVIGTRWRVWLEGALLFDLHDARLSSGSIVLFSAVGGAQFAKLHVETARPQWLDYATIKGVGMRTLGQRLRVVAGRKEDMTAPSVAGEVRLFQDFQPGDASGIRLPAEGIDLRLLDRTGAVAHMRRFAPSAAFVPSAVRVLRAADATSLILVSADPAAPGGTRLKPGIYRMSWSFRRDNKATVPDSLLLSEHGQRDAETVSIDVVV